MKSATDTLIVQYLGRQGEPLLQCKLFSTPLREEAVLRACMEFFSDPEPCMLHRSAAMSRLYMELLEYFLQVLEGEKSRCTFSDMPERLAGFIDIRDCHEIILNRV